MRKKEKTGFFYRFYQVIRHETVILTEMAVLTLSIVLVFLPKTAIAQISCAFTQITSATGGNSDNSSINTDGTRIAFRSDSDLTGGNADGNREIFLFNAATSAFTQITSATGGSSSRPSINADGTRIAFDSNSDITGGNADGNREIFLFNAATSAFTQITSTTGGGSSRSSINADGTRIAFDSNRDLTGGNADDSREIFLFNTTTSAFTQITSATGGNSFNSSINSDGTRIAFDSKSDLTGGNADGNFEVFLFNTTTSAFTQITSAIGGVSHNPSINADGTRIAFRSNRDLTGGNADGNFEVFLFNTTTSAFTQITSAAGGGSASPSINADGTRIAFRSNRDLTGGNADDNREIFLFNTITSAFTQITSTTGGGSDSPSINADGMRVAFESDRDITGGNADNNSEIFLCVPPTPGGTGTRVYIDPYRDSTPYTPGTPAQ